MIQTAIFHSVNAGLYFYTGKTGIWIDCIHQGAENGFSMMPIELVRQLYAHSGLFSKTDGFLFTHLHSDHFDRLLLQQAVAASKQVKIYGPGLSLNSFSPSEVWDGLKRFEIGDVEVFAFESTHDGNCFHNVPHESFVLRVGTDCFFVAGDAMLFPEQANLLLRCGCSSVESAFINAYQLSSEGGNKFLQILSPKRIFLVTVKGAGG